VQVLGFGGIVHDRDACERCVGARQPPLVAEHGDETALRAPPAPPAGGEAVHLRAAGLLGARQVDVEQRATGVSVDFDQARTALVEMKVVTEKYTGLCGSCAAAADARASAAVRYVGVAITASTASITARILSTCSGVTNTAVAENRCGRVARIERYNSLSPSTAPVRAPAPPG